MLEGCNLSHGHRHDFMEKNAVAVARRSYMSKKFKKQLIIDDDIEDCKEFKVIKLINDYFGTTKRSRSSSELRRRTGLLL